MNDIMLIKRLTLYILAAVAVFTACSKNNHVPQPESDPDAWMYDVTLPVPIEFGASNPVTKGELVEDLRNASGYFGVFGVDKSDTDLSGYPDSLLLNNAKASYNSANKILDLNSRTFYPMTNDRNFNFYAYHAWSAASDMGESEELPSAIKVSNGIFVEVPIGKSDVLYGSTKVSPTEANELGCNGYNARFIRKTLEKGKQEYKPNISFRHVTSAIQFHVKTVSAYAADVFNTELIDISQVYIKDMPVTARLCIVDLENDELDTNVEYANANEGTFDISNSTMDKIYVWKLNGESDTWYLNQRPTETQTELGYPIYIVPQKEKIEGEILLNVSSLNPIPFVLDPDQMGLVTNGFEAGYVYDVVLTLYSPEKVEITVSVEEWKDGFGGNGQGVIELG